MPIHFLSWHRSSIHKQRPKHLALHLIKLPLPGIVSILHRASGLMLFAALPLLLLMLQYSLRSIETYTLLFRAEPRFILGKSEEFGVSEIL